MDIGGTVHLPKDQQFLSVPAEEWRRIVSRVKTIGGETNTLESIAFALLGVGGGALVPVSALLASVDYSKTVGNSEVVNWKGWVWTTATIIVGVACLGIGAVSLYHARDKRQFKKQNLDVPKAGSMPICRSR